MDGGTITIDVIDTMKKTRRLRLDQNLTSSGRLYLDNWKVPYRTVVEKTILEDIAHCLENRPLLPPPPSIKAGERVKRPGGGGIMFGSQDLVQCFSLNQEDRITWLLSEILRRVSSKDYGEPPENAFLRRI